jgi:hypothetical protein
MSPTDIFLGGTIIALLAWLIVPRINRDVAAKAQRRREQEDAAKKPTGAWSSDDIKAAVELNKPDPDSPVDPKAYD